VFGRASGVMVGDFNVLDSGRTIRFAPLRPFFPGEMVTVLVSAAIKSGGGQPLTNGYTWGFWIRSAATAGPLVQQASYKLRIGNERGITAYGAYAGDLDRDGAADFSIPTEFGDDVRVLTNDGCGQLAGPARFTLPRGSKPSTNEGQDFNSDGFINLATGNIDGASIAVFLGDGQGGYLPPVLYPSGANVRGITVLDAEADGDIDIVTANRTASNLALFRNAT
jgi:hypothetical protein